MILLRVGELGFETTAALDKNKKLRNLSGFINDFNPDTINFENLEKLKKIHLEDLPEIKTNRI